MNLLAMMTLAVLVPSGDTENTDVWVRVSSNHVEILPSSSGAGAKAMQARGAAGVLLKCKTLKINYTAEGQVIECEGCTFYNSKGKNGTASSAVFDQVKGILTLTGDETKPVEWTTSNENGEQKIVSQSMQITLLRSESKRINSGDPLFDVPRLDPFVSSEQIVDPPEDTLESSEEPVDLPDLFTRPVDPNESLGRPVDTLRPERKNN